MPDYTLTAEQVQHFKTEGYLVFKDPTYPKFPASDLDHCIALDRFDRALLVERQDDLLVMRPVR